MNKAKYSKTFFLTIMVLLLFSTFNSLEGKTIASDQENQTLRLLTPNGNQILSAGQKIDIAWEPGQEEQFEFVTLEYSHNNGSIYSTIAESITNNGSYTWTVPHDMAANCRIRIRNATTYSPNPEAAELLRKHPDFSGLTMRYRFRFRLGTCGLETIEGRLISTYLGRGDKTRNNSNIPVIHLEKENSMYYIAFADCRFDVELLTPGWNRMEILYHTDAGELSLWLNHQPVIENIQVSRDHWFHNKFSIAPGSDSVESIDIDDISIAVQSIINKGNSFGTLFTESFDRLGNHCNLNKLESLGYSLIDKNGDARFASLKNAGNFILKTEEISHGHNDFITLKPWGHEIPVISKRFSLPQSWPFDISDNEFEIRDDAYVERENRRERKYAQNTIQNEHKYGPSDERIGNDGLSFPPSISKSQRVSQMSDTAGMINTYYIYSFDGKLMAEYHPQTGKYYYHMTDQHNSTRMITDDNGTVAYSSAHSPYGEKQKMWVNAYEPKLQFSGKERETYSDLDYFGARYYGQSLFRFASVDPTINKTDALYNPQLWNLYTYSRNNPINYSDPDGRFALPAIVYGIIEYGIPVLAAALAIDPLQKTIQKIQDSGGISIDGDSKNKRDMISDSMKEIFTSHNESGETNKKGGGKTGRKTNKNRIKSLDKQIQIAKEAKSNAKTKKEKEKFQDRIDHLRRKKKASESHARKGQGY